MVTLSPVPVSRLPAPKSSVSIVCQNVLHTHEPLTGSQFLVGEWYNLLEAKDNDVRLVHRIEAFG
jgi:hypothetical protein